MGARGRRLRGIVRERRESVRVENGRAKDDAVSTPVALERYAARRERSTELRHVSLETVRRGCRRALPPNLVDEPAVGHDLAGTKQQGSENGTLLAAAQLDGAFSDLGFERAEDAEPEWL